jgi:hypothetical protein
VPKSAAVFTPSGPCSVNRTWSPEDRNGRNTGAGGLFPADCRPSTIVDVCRNPIIPCRPPFKQTASSIELVYAVSERNTCLRICPYWRRAVGSLEPDSNVPDNWLEREYTVTQLILPVLFRGRIENRPSKGLIDTRLTAYTKLSKGQKHEQCSRVY